MNQLIKFSFFAVLTMLAAACGQKGEQAVQEEIIEEDMGVAAGEASTTFGGLALYSLRDTMAGDPKAVLQEVAEMGYAYIEAAGYADGKFYGMSPSDFKAYLASVGLTPVSTHMGMATVENVDTLVAHAKAAGFEYFVIPVPPMGGFAFDAATMTLSMTQDAETVMNNVNAIAAQVAAGGLTCLYHNHDFEFKADENGLVPIDYFLENSDPAVLNFQMDLYWVTRAGADPLAYFEKYPGRWKSWHVKDMDDEGRFAPVGEGNIDFAPIREKQELAGMEFYFVEQDVCFKHTPLEAVNISRKGLEKFGFSSL